MTSKYINYDVNILSFELLTKVRPVMTSCNPKFSSYSKRTPNGL
jgi:hypothetical protein